MVRTTQVQALYGALTFSAHRELSILVTAHKQNPTLIRCSTAPFQIWKTAPYPSLRLRQDVSSTAL